MNELPPHVVQALIGFACGLAIGFVARANRFCTFGAIEDCVMARRTERIRAWGLAIAVAVLLVSALYASGMARIDETFYLANAFPLGGVVIGGLLFGFGMAMVGTCGFGVLVRFGGGDLKALVAVLVLGLSAYAAARGITSGLRQSLASATMLDLSEFGGQGLPHLLAPVLGLEVAALWLPVGAAISVCLLAWCFGSQAFRRSRRDIVSGLVVGAAVAAGFAGSGIIGNDAFDTQPVVSMTYALPPGETIIYFLTYSGAAIGFGIGSVLGTIVGAFLAALWKSDFRLEAFDGRREMRRHLGGAFLMGFGGLAALGCTVGQGMTGISTLSVASPIVLLSIFLGASFGIHYLVSDGLLDAWRSLTGLGSDGSVKE